ncbi:MAG: helix-turn-helix domain-containing protein [Clostridiales bacterium]|nr:helix-turn-helix transcriptional regulator [Clostridia bacterium]MCR4563639.1 helix-turn-helix domain-containing protein [Clostridiales bacterium]
MKFNERLKFLRRSSKLTQEQVATYIGVKRVAYTAYEAGRTSPSLENLVKLAQLYNVTTDTLLSCYTNASSVINSFEKEFENNADRFSPECLTAEERNLIAAYRASGKGEQISAYIKRITKEK